MCELRNLDNPRIPILNRLENLMEKLGLPQVDIKLVKVKTLGRNKQILSQYDGVCLAHKLLYDADREMIAIINLDAKLVPINCSIVSMGILNASVTTPREIIKSSILSNAANIILLHNHPSGDPTPSDDDIQLTNRLLKACGIMGISLVDHIIIGGNTTDAYSLRENELINIKPTKHVTINELKFT